MREICNSYACTGCMACANVCAHQAIKVKKDEEGFDRPVIDEALCVDCGLCKQVCPVNNHPTTSEPLKVYSGWSSDENVRLSSSSGGAFSEIARPILEDGGVVFGCSLDEKLQAVHTYVETMEDLAAKLRGSKYVQSRIGDSYSKAREFLKQGRKVLFSGTPCQIAGLRNYLRRDYDNLITVDLICHGVPSPMIFEDYKKYIAESQKMTITDVKFRCKKSSWIFYNMTVTGHVEREREKKIYIGRYYEDPYIRGFLNDIFLRPSCSLCKFTSVKRIADFTIADWWGYDKLKNESRDFERKGVSLLYCNSIKATTLFSNKISKKFIFRKRNLAESLMTNNSLKRPFHNELGRKSFWKLYFEKGFIPAKKVYMKKIHPNIIFYVKYHLRSSFVRDILLWILFKIDACLRRLHIGRLIKW